MSRHVRFELPRSSRFKIHQSLFILILSGLLLLSGCAGVVSTPVHAGGSGPAALSISVGSLPSGQAKSAYSASLAVTGGTAPYTWSISSGSLPAGLSLSGSGQISGTPTTTGTSSFTVSVIDSSSPVESTTANLSIAIAAAATGVQITTSSLAAGQTNTSYSASLTATGGTAPYTWSVSSGSLPAGLTLSNAGQISGTPSTAGTSSFTVAVSDSSSPAATATANLSIAISASATAVHVTTPSLSGGVIKTAYSAMLAATGGKTPYSWLVSSGSLPAGLALSAAGQISGTPTTAGTYSFTVKVTDSSSPAQTATANLSIPIAASGTPLKITTSSLPAGVTNTSYSATLAATGGKTSYSWSVSSGALPTGLTLGSSGQISGTPTAAGTFSFTVRVTDSSSPAQSVTANLSITTSGSVTPVQITTSSLASGQIGTAYSASLAAGGGKTPYSWSVSSGSLPTGLSLISSGQISGTPTAAGKFSFVVKVIDSSSPAQSATANLSIGILSSSGSGGATAILCPNSGQTGNNANCMQPPTLAFGKQGASTTSAALFVSVNNCSTPNIPACTGTGNLTLGSPYFSISGANSADFANTASGTCSNGLVLASGSSCTIVLRFTPTQSAGTNEVATLNVSTDSSSGPQTVSLTGTSATVTTISSCQSLSSNTNYQLTASVSAPGSCFIVSGSNTDINLDGFTVTYCTSSSSNLVGGVFMTGYPTSGTVVHNGTINEGGGSCTGTTPTNTYGSGAIIASSDGASSATAGTSVFNVSSTIKAAKAKFVFEENAGMSTSLATVIHDVTYIDDDTYSCNGVGCRDMDQGYPVVVDQAVSAGGSHFYNIVGTGGTQGGLVTNAPNSLVTNNHVSPGNSTSTNTNGFAYQDWGTNITMNNNIVVGTGPAGTCVSCRGIQISSVANNGTTGSQIENNDIYLYNLNNDSEYSGCQIDGAFGMQINDAGSTANLSGNTMQHNNITAVSGVCPATAFSWSSTQTLDNGPNITRNNRFVCELADGYTAGPCVGIRLAGYQYSSSAPDNGVESYGDYFQGDTADVWIYYAGTPTWTCNQCTFNKSSTAVSNWVFFSYDSGLSSGAPSHPVIFIDPTFTGGAAESSNDLSSYASNNPLASFYYMIEFTQTVTVTGSSGNPISGATVTYTDALSNHYVGTSNANGVATVVVNENRYAAANGSYTITHYNGYSLSVSAPGCTTNTSTGISITSPNSVTISLPGC
jgi:hypothetical protein